MWSPLASASLVFLILYSILFITLARLFALKSVPWKSRWLVLLLHILVRLAAQAYGLSFGIIGYRNTDLLVSYYVLGAEGYFTLVVCTARYLIAWQRNHWNGYSWIEPIDPTKERGGWRKRFKRLVLSKQTEKTLAAKVVVVVDWLLVAANTVIVTGGSLSAAAYTDKHLTRSQSNNRLVASRAMRAAGQVMFLAVNTVLLVCIVVTVHQHRHHRYDDATSGAGETPLQEVGKGESLETRKPRPWYAHPTLLLLLLTWPFLSVRGGFGVAQALVPDLNYFNPEVYDTSNLDPAICDRGNLFGNHDGVRRCSRSHIDILLDPTTSQSSQ